MTKKTIVVGASPNPSRYSYHATKRLDEAGHEVVPLGIRAGSIDRHEIKDLRSFPNLKDIDTITLYLSPQNQEEWKDYLLSLNPKRIIFNPGAENSTLEKEAKAQKIETINACTLVMLSVGNY